MLKSQMNPARLLRMLKRAIKATTWERIGAAWIGRNSTRSITTPARNESATESTKATQNGSPHAISCQAIKVENIAISPCAKLRWSIAW